MKVFKFGGSSVRDYSSYVSLVDIIKKNNEEDLIIVLSAIGKTTSLLGEISNLRIKNKDYKDKLDKLYDTHFLCLKNLKGSYYDDALIEINKWYDSLLRSLLLYSSDSKHKFYDKIISFGEIASTYILFFYLKQEGIDSEWVDARKIIITDSNYGIANVDIDATTENVQSIIKPLILKNKIVVTQGFIGSDRYGDTTTLGKEGSDYSGALISNILKAKALVVWKDVPGIMNADPKDFKNPVKLDEISYKEMAEMSFYGAQVIHPKTIEPLSKECIPLYIFPFDNINSKGTIVHDDASEISEPIYMLRKNQCLITLSISDFTFIDENKLSHIFRCLENANLKINIMERLALSFSICVEDNSRIDTFLDKLKEVFIVTYTKKLKLLTIKNIDKDSKKKSLLENKKVFLEQKNGNMLQVLYR